MGRKQGPRKGSMQIWPRKRAQKFLPEVNWNAISIEHQAEKAGLMGFIAYKAGMASAFVKDNTPDSMTKNKRIILPVTILEAPPLKIHSVRFYKGNKVLKDVLNDNLDKELKKVVKLPKNKVNAKEMIEKMTDFDDITLVCYTQAKKTGIKKSPDISEIGLFGKKEEKLQFVKDNLAKEISISEVFQKGLVDARGLTIGRGFQGTVKRFGVHLRNHKAEKGVRRVGSIGGWHPIGIRFTVPRPGQMGMHSRIIYNNVVIASKKLSAEDEIGKKPFKHYGIVKNDYLVLGGNVNGPVKRQVLITATLRPTKKQLKRQYELLELR